MCPASTKGERAKSKLGMFPPRLAPLPPTPAQLKAKLSSLHGQLATLPGAIPISGTRWLMTMS